MTAPSGATPSRPSQFSRAGLIVVLMMLALYALLGIIESRYIDHGLAPGGVPPFYDFSAFYEAGAFANQGHATQAYDDKVMAAAIAAHFPGTRTRLPWNYPPTLQVLFMPLAAAPYALAWLIWCGALYGLYLLVVSKLFTRENLWLAIVLPAAAVNIDVGQNGLLTVAVMGGGVLALERRPWLGGAVLGLLTVKPHFAVLAPVLVIATRQWRALAGEVLSATAIALVSLVLLGPEPWFAFIHKVLAPSGVLNSSTSDWHTVPSVQILARSLGANPLLANLLHYSVALAATCGAVFVWLRCKGARLRAAALGAAAVLVTPYLRVYDLAVWALPLAALSAPMNGRKPSVIENVMIVVAWLAPAVLLFWAPKVQLAPVISVAVMILVVWRAMPDSRPQLSSSIAKSQPGP